MLAMLRNWRQGDYTLDAPQFLVADSIEDGELVGSAVEVIGFAVVSQTCDVVNYGHDKQWVAVSPLVKVTPESYQEINGGRTPAAAALQNPPAENVVVDLNRMMTIHKSALAGLNRMPGFVTDEARSEFAACLERKHGRFAFPDVFNNGILGPLRKRIKDAHKKDSDNGKAYRSIDTVRVSASPSWESSEIEVGFRFVLAPEDRREANREAISKVIAAHLATLKWPVGYKPAKPQFILETLDDMRAKDWVESQPIDWNFISRSA